MEPSLSNTPSYPSTTPGDRVLTEREWIDGGDGVLFDDGVEGACIEAGDAHPQFTLFHSILHHRKLL